MMQLFGFLITGFIVGLIARAVKPGEDQMGVGKTILLGMGGALLVGWIGRELGWYTIDEGVGFAFSTVGAIVVLTLSYLTTRGRSTRLRPHG